MVNGVLIGILGQLRTNLTPDTDTLRDTGLSQGPSKKCLIFFQTNYILFLFLYGQQFFFWGGEGQLLGHFSQIFCGTNIFNSLFGYKNFDYFQIFQTNVLYNKKFIFFLYFIISTNSKKNIYIKPTTGSYWDLISFCGYHLKC